MVDALVLLAKEPRPGLSKTRLASEIGTDAAHRVAHALVLDTLDVAHRSIVDLRLVAYAPSDAAPWFEHAAPWAELTPQPNVPFGERLRASIREALSRGAARCVVIGMDTPQITPGTVRSAFDALQRVDVCLGPAADGGYYLIGVRGDHPELVDGIPWSTDAVLRTTLDRCERAGLAVEQLGVERDVDVADDARALLAALEARPGVATRTRDVLGTLDLNRS